MTSFVCPRCDYSSKYKTDIKRHFARKNPCTNKNNLDLNEEIIDRVLKDKFYNPRRNVESMQSVINYNNTVNQFANHFDAQEKLGHINQYEKRRLLSFEDALELFFEPRLKRLADETFKALYGLQENDFMNIINGVTRIESDKLDRLNLIYDKKTNRFLIYDGVKWEIHLTETGLREVVSLVKSYFLNNYELYLIKNLNCENPVVKERLSLREHLEIYYKFLACFNLPIHITEHSDYDVLGHRLLEDNEYTLKTIYEKVYEDIKTEMKDIDKTRLKQKILLIIKENTIHNVNELNKVFLELLKVDESFQKMITASKCTHPIKL